MLAGLRQRTSRRWITVLILAVFVAAGNVRFRKVDGEDLSSSYVGCRLLATGHTGVLYSFDAENFADVGDLTGTWKRLGKAGGFPGYLHPYVQTPLWAYLLQPLCNHTMFGRFKHIFLLPVMLSLAGVIWLVGRYWTPWVSHPVPIALLTLGLWFSQPFGYAMYLMQTHALFFFLAILGLVLAGRNDRRWNGWWVAGWAGLAVACAAAVKLTPIVLVLYWLLIGRWKAAVSTLFWTAVLAAATVVAVGPGLTGAYLESLHRVSRVLLVAQNNQSFAAWTMARFYSPDEVFDINVLPLPTAVRLGSMALMLACTAAGGWLDRRVDARRKESAGFPPVGAMMALIALTIFAPIAWTHYFILLIAPVMVLLQAMRSGGRWWLLLALVPAIALNYPPLASNVLTMDIGDYAVVRGQFFSGVLLFVALGVAGWWAARGGEPAPGLDAGRQRGDTVDRMGALYS